MYQNDAMRVLTGEVRLSYVHLSAPYANPNQVNAKPKYSVTLLIPKSDHATKADIDNSMTAAANGAVNTKWQGIRPPQIPFPIHDGDSVRQDGTPYGDECKGCWVMTASSENPPQVVDQSNINCPLAPQDIYSGMYGRVTVRFFGYNNGGKKGIGCGLGNVMKTRDGEPLAGGASASADFAGVGQAVTDTAPAYGAAMPATPGAAGYAPAPQPAVYYPPQYPAAQVAPAAAPVQQINPITGMPM